MASKQSSSIASAVGLILAISSIYALDSDVISHETHILLKVSAAIGIITMIIGMYWARRATDQQNLDVWHKAQFPFWPVQDAIKVFSLPPGQLWRRRLPNGKWEYSADPQTYEEWEDNQW
ncbi:hypothetical protein [Rhizobium sp. RU36D]|uniref:hypothetical protein n=1 Tax=Rhizobium sp. RU36D TaxID=1907415 RepID=UPI0009D7B5E9|nr:hypothetical protein [Rhizobium sp. RU36D]SMD21149.1 hypothetical protein SAMN05880593_1661 [Rhizobium sp. RU36D]